MRSFDVADGGIVLPCVVGDVEHWTLVDTGGGMVDAGRECVVVVRLPEANMHVQCRRKGRDLHIIRPLAGLSHLHHMSLKFLLQLFFGVELQVDGSGSSSPVLGPALRVASDRVNHHVLAIKVGILPHVGYGRISQGPVLSLVAIKLVGQGVEQAVAVALDIGCIEGIGVEDRKFRWLGGMPARRSHVDKLMLQETAGVPVPGEDVGKGARRTRVSRPS